MFTKDGRDDEWRLPFIDTVTPYTKYDTLLKCEDIMKDSEIYYCNTKIAELLHMYPPLNLQYIATTEQLITCWQLVAAIKYNKFSMDLRQKILIKQMMKNINLTIEEIIHNAYQMDCN